MEGQKAQSMLTPVNYIQISYQAGLGSIQGVDFDLSPVVNVSSKTTAILAQLFQEFPRTKILGFPRL